MIEKPHTSMEGEPFVAELLKCQRGSVVIESLGTGRVAKRRRDW